MSKAPVVQPAGNYYDKYSANNPIVRWMMDGFMSAFDELVRLSGERGRALEIGCGEGELSIRLARAGFDVAGCDIAAEAIDEAHARAARAGVAIDFSVLGIDDARHQVAPAPLVACCEVLEHLDDTEAALDALAALSSGHVLVSVPREPLWRVLNLARLKYVRDLGNTPGHIQHWSRTAFIRALESRFEVVAVRSPLPWTMALCRVAR
jgi:2-polyprenyl-3-methyl-5-hydroxy-6-metoxy-1,4-benzoquinol methylase